MERGETRVEKALQAGSGIEWHVYRMGHLTDYFVGTARSERREWRAFHPSGERLDCMGFTTRREAIAALCYADDQRNQ